MSGPLVTGQLVAGQVVGRRQVVVGQGGRQENGAKLSQVGFLEQFFEVVDGLKSFRGVETGGEGISCPGPVPKGDMMPVFAEGFGQDHAGFAGGKIGQHPGPIEGHPGRTGDQQYFHEKRLTVKGWRENIRLADCAGTTETHRGI